MIEVRFHEKSAHFQGTEAKMSIEWAMLQGGRCTRGKKKINVSNL